MNNLTFLHGWTCSLMKELGIDEKSPDHEEAYLSIYDAVQTAYNEGVNSGWEVSQIPKDAFIYA